jgi:hypothetical protein
MHWEMRMRHEHSSRPSLHSGGLRQLAVVALAAASLGAAACGASVPTKPEAAAALSKAIESRLTRTLPMSTYCQTVRSDFSFANMGQMDLVEMFQNLGDKGPLNDAAAAGVVRVELKEFRVSPGGRSPDPSCDALYEQYKNGAGGPVRFAVVRTALTPKGTAAGVQFDTPIEVATRELVDVTDIRAGSGGAAVVKYTWRWKTTAMADAIGFKPDEPKAATASLRRADAGWTVKP